MTLSNSAVGISLKGEFYDDLLKDKHNIDFLEAHIENYFDGGFHLETLKLVAEKYPITLHGVGLSLASSDAPLSREMMQRKNIIDIIKPVFFSEHAAWTRSKNSHLNDLLPFPMTLDTANRLANNISLIQDILKRPILIENLSSYVTFDEDTYNEADFMNVICQKSGCFMLLDINNIYVQQYNLGRSAKDYIHAINPKYVKQYHLAGGEKSSHSDMMIDTHGTDISGHVMDLYKMACQKIGLRPTLYERDNNIPAFADMLETVRRIRQAQKDIHV